MVIKVTFGEILDAPVIGSWDKFCEKHGYNLWCINEGLAQRDMVAEISIEEAKEYGLLHDIFG